MRFSVGLAALVMMVLGTVATRAQDHFRSEMARMGKLIKSAGFSS